MSENKWLTTKKADVPCGVCGKVGTCLVAPDGTGFKCWRDGGKVHQMNGHPRTNGNGNGYRGSYVGKAHRQVKPGSVPKRAPRVYPTPDAAIEAAGRAVVGGTLAGTWSYADAAGAEVMRVARFNLPDGAKEFRPVHRASNTWKIGDPAGPLPLYRLPELPEAGPVFVTEGEKAADAARSVGLPATTSAHGSSSAGGTNWIPLGGREVVILPDHDEPGLKYARDVATLLAKLEPPARVKIVELPGLPRGGDVVEFITARRDAAPEVVCGQIRALADAVSFINSADLIGGPVMTCMADVQPQDVQWLWPGRVPVGRITLLVGKPGEGKSFITIDMGARVTTGTPWPDAAGCPSGSVIFICAEDDPADTIRPRLDAHHADVRRVHLLSAVRRVGEDGKRHEVMFTLADVRALEAALRSVPDCKLVVIDPIGSFLGGHTDAHRDNEVRSVLAPIAALAERYGVAVVIVAHRRKSTGSSADDLALGSRAFTGIARAVWHVTRDSADSRRRLLLPGKNNLAPEGTGMAFGLVGQPVASVAWEREPVRMTADDALAAEQGSDRERPGPDADARKDAADWLRKLLAGGPRPTKEVQDEAKNAGMAWRTVRRAADELRVKREHCPDGKHWQWRLPERPDLVGQPERDENDLDNLDNVCFPEEIQVVSEPRAVGCPSSEDLDTTVPSEGAEFTQPPLSSSLEDVVADPRGGVVAAPPDLEVMCMTLARARGFPSLNLIHHPGRKITSGENRWARFTDSAPVGELAEALLLLDDLPVA
jgi:hypothetical protein